MVNTMLKKVVKVDFAPAVRPYTGLCVDYGITMKLFVYSPTDLVAIHHTVRMPRRFSRHQMQR